jgi:hypothetical protein
MAKDANSIGVRQAVVPSATCGSYCQHQHRARAHRVKAKGEAFIMKRRKFISAVPAAILLAQRPSAAIDQTRKKGVMLINRIRPSSSERCVAKADGHDKRRLTDSLWEDAMPPCIPAKVY